jgi:hypothetical protein
LWVLGLRGCFEGAWVLGQRWGRRVRRGVDNAEGTRDWGMEKGKGKGKWKEMYVNRYWIGWEGKIELR